MEGRAATEDVDFEFWLNITQYLIPDNEPFVWILGEEEPTYRGGRNLQVDVPQVVKGDLEMDSLASNAKHGKKRVAWNGEGQSHRRREDHEAAGLPPWVRTRNQPWRTVAGIEDESSLSAAGDSIYIETSQSFDRTEPFLQLPSRTLLDWATEYCQSRKPLKEFRVRRHIHGWALPLLRADIEEILRQNQPPDCTTVRATTKLRSQDIIVRSPSALWGTLKNERPILTWFLWITLIYPLIIWPLRYLLEGRWQIAGISFAFQKWIHLDGSKPGDTPEDYAIHPYAEYSDLVTGRLRLYPELKKTARGLSQLIGTRRHDFLREWAEEIAVRAATGYQSKFPLLAPMASTYPQSPRREDE
jgi:hypothetical protein